MNKFRIIYIFIICFLLSCNMFSDENKSDIMETPVWFCGSIIQGLDITVKNEIIYNQHKITAIPENVKIYAAAFYPNTEKLIIVTNNSRVILLQKKENKYVEQNRFADKNAIINTVRFTTVPGLVYILTEDTTVLRRIKEMPMIQEYASRYYKIALSSEAQKYSAIEDELKSKLVTTFYTYEGNFVTIYLPDNLKIPVKLPEPLALPYRSGPYDDLGQNIFVFRKNGILCLGESAWHLFDIQGNLIKSFPFKDIEYFGWDDPYYKNNYFYINAKTKPETTTYRLDVLSGELLKE